MAARAAHVIAEIDYRTPVPREQAPTTCSCGWEGTAAAFDEHRRTAPQEGQDMGRTGPTAKQQEAWDLVSGEGLSQVDAADRLGITQAGVQSRLRGYMEAKGLPGPIPGYGGGNGPITFRRVSPEVLDAPATIFAASVPPTGTPAEQQVVSMPAPEAVAAARDGAGDTAIDTPATLAAVEVPTVPVLVEAGPPDEPEDQTVEAPPASGGIPAGASTVIPWPAAADHETRDVLDVFIRERDRLGAEIARVDEQLEQLTQVRERLLTMRSAVEDTLGLYAEHLTAGAAA